MNGNKEGKGSQYYANGELRYKGDWRNDKKEGKGWEFYENGDLKYEGDFEFHKLE